MLSHPGYCHETISLKKYSTQAIPVPNPLQIEKLPVGETFQVTHSNFVIQFFFSGQDILGIILKRNNKLPIHMRWCFFRSCAESPYDYTVVIAPASSPPFNQGFFTLKFPPQMYYQFQGLHFYSPK